MSRNNTFLMAVPNPREYQPFLDSIASIDYVDIFYAKYMEGVTAMQVIKTFFLDHDYDYLMICQDDYVVPLLGPLKIMMDVNMFGHDIVCGWCQIGSDRSISNIGCVPVFVYENYLDQRFEPLKDYLLPITTINKHILGGLQLIEVQFTGHTLCAISRRAVELWDPRAWYFHELANKRKFIYRDGVWGAWEGIDTWFSYEMTKKEIPIWADLTVFVRHDAPDYENLLVGKRRSTTQFVPRIR